MTVEQQIETYRKQKMREYHREYYKAHREAIKERARKYYAEHKEERIAYGKQYDAEHPEQQRERRRNWRKNHAEEVYAYQKAWRNANKEYMRRFRESEEYRIKMREYPREYKKGYRKLLKAAHCCTNCGRQDALTLNGRSLCSVCLEKGLQYRIKRFGVTPLAILRDEREKRRAEKRAKVNYPRGGNGICWQCNKKPVKEGYKLCPECYEARVRIQNENKEKCRPKANHPWRYQWKYK